jgi:phosphopantothenoylcysteine decarboxylase/phosphopantothenate--cysteine ligase
VINVIGGGGSIIQEDKRPPLIIKTQTKELACQSTGDGALAEPLDIFWHASKILLQDSFWQNRRVVVTGGGTIEKIDEVRYISNFSSGKMASSLATALYLKGADVNLIATRFEPNLPHGIHTIEVQDSQEMMEYLVDSIRIAKKGKLSKATLMRDEHIHLIQKTPYLFMAAAVSDYVPSFAQQGKLKKELLGESWALQLKKNVDILSTINKDGIITIGFKAEMDPKEALNNARNMLKNKALDGVCLNILQDAQSFGTQSNEIEFVTPDETFHLPKEEKLALSLKLLTYAQKLHKES